jgi:hypothetical protein
MASLQAAVAGAFVLTLAAGVIGEADSLTAREVVAQVRKYLADYRPRLAELVAQEEYEQIEAGGENRPRVLVSDFATIRADDGMWVGFRDVWNVDGRDLPDRQARADRLFRNGRPDWTTARQIIQESARYNVGGRLRDFNTPVAPLELFAESRAWCCRMDVRPVGGSRAASRWTVEARETTRPTLIRTPEGRPAYARAQALVDPVTGAITRIDLTVGKPDPVTMSVTFEWNAALELWLPAEMRESSRGPSGTTEGRARYSRWRRFSVSSRIVAPPAA